MRVLVLAMSAVMVATTPLQAATPTCARELAATETGLVRTLVRIKGVAQASPDARCAAYRSHIEVMSRAREVFVRCKSGPERDADVGQVEGAISDAKAVAQSCPGV
jgi:hypothetical protein